MKYTLIVILCAGLVCGSAIGHVVLKRNAVGAEDRCNAVPGYLTESAYRCRAEFDTFTYNKQTNVCDPFEYGGCGASPNLFWTLEECQRTCGVH